MYCTNCGNKILDGYKFCSKCGIDADSSYQKNKSESLITKYHNTWIYRFLKVIYIALYIPLPFILIGVWSINSSTYDYYYHTRIDTTSEALWYTVLTLIIYVVIIRLVKIAVKYVAVGQKPNWYKELRKFF